MNKKDCIRFIYLFFTLIVLSQCGELSPLGNHEAVRTYVEFADGSNRGRVDPVTGEHGYPDEGYDATSAMVINWHRLPESDSRRNARLHYRKITPTRSDWKLAEGKYFEFWFREELVNRVVLRELDPGSIYEYKVSENGKVFRIRTMPSDLEERSVKIVMTSDHQTPSWSDISHANAKIAALQKPDMFVVAGDFVNDEGRITSENADHWATYLDNLYGSEDGYFIYDKEIDGEVYENLVIPHVGVLGNHETGEEHHIRWPTDLYASQPGYPMFVAANWMELLFHWPFRSEGFYSEFRPDHPNMNPDHVREGFGHGGFGTLSFSDYLLFIGMDNSQNWEGPPDQGLRDWKGDRISEKWPWFETHHSDVRQDLWLKDVLEPKGEISAGERYTHILPVWHRGLFGTARMNMTLKNRGLLNYWLPLLYRNGVKLIKEGHDHNYARTVPMKISEKQPENTYIEDIYYQPQTWKLSEDLDQSYVDEFYAIRTLNDLGTDDIVGWGYGNKYISYDSEGMIVIGHGGWSAGRRKVGERGGGNAGMWFVDSEKGGDAYGNRDSFHMTTVHLTNDHLTVEAFHPDQLSQFIEGKIPDPFYRFRWNITEKKWLAFDFEQKKWVRYESHNN